MTNDIKMQITRITGISITRVDNGYIVNVVKETLTEEEKPQLEIGPFGIPYARRNNEDPSYLVFTSYNSLRDFLDNIGWP